MVASHQCDWHTGIHNLPKLQESDFMPSRVTPLVLKPEIEQVSIEYDS